MNIVAIIPARSGSKGVPKKNIKLLENYPLLSYSVAVAKLSTKISRVIVSTDSQEVAEIAEKFGAEVPFLRPSELSGDTSKDIDYIRHALEFLKEKEGYEVDLVVLLRPTTPLREVAFIDDAIAQLLSQNLATSLRSSHEAAESPFKWFHQENGFYKEICDKYSLEDTNNPRQFFQKVYIPNGYVDILIPKSIEKSDSLYGDKIMSFITPYSYEIDTLSEFEFIEYLVSKEDNKLLKYLKRVSQKNESTL